MWYPPTTRDAPKYQLPTLKLTVVPAHIVQQCIVYASEPGCQFVQSESAIQCIISNAVFQQLKWNFPSPNFSVSSATVHPESLANANYQSHVSSQLISSNVLRSSYEKWTLSAIHIAYTPAYETLKTAKVTSCWAWVSQGTFILWTRLRKKYWILGNCEITFTQG